MIDQALGGLITFHIDHPDLRGFSTAIRERMALITETRIAPILLDIYGGIVEVRVRLEVVPANDVEQYNS